MKPRITSRPFVALLVLLGLSTVLAACGGGSSRQESSSSPPPSSPPTASAPSQPAAAPPAQTASPAAASATGVIEVVATDEGGQFRFTPSVIEARPGQELTVRVVNRGASAHDLALSDLRQETGLIDPGQEKSLTFRAPSTPGEYAFVCTVPGHQQLGMQGKLVVR